MRTYPLIYKQQSSYLYIFQDLFKDIVFHKKILNIANERTH